MRISENYHIISKWFRNLVGWGASEPLIPPHVVLDNPYMVVVCAPADTPFRTFLLWAENIEDASRRFNVVKSTYLVWDENWTVTVLEIDKREVYDLDPLSITYLTTTR